MVRLFHKLYGINGASLLYKTWGEVVVLNKSNVGSILGVLSILPVIICFVIFYVLRGPNADIYFFINIFSALSIIGISFAISSFVISKRFILFIIGILGNRFVLVCTFF